MRRHKFISKVRLSGFDIGKPLFDARFKGGGEAVAPPAENFLLLEGDFSGALLLEGDFSGELLLEGTF
jgi:hypothetical protein